MDARSVIAAILTLAPVATAGGFDARLVSADAPWVLHVDFEAVAKSTLLRTFHEQGQKIENELDLDEVQKQFGIDPLAELGSMTMYAVGSKDEGIATVVSGSEKLGSAYARLSEQATRAKVAGRDALILGRGESARYVRLEPARAGSARVALIATSTIALQRALGVLDGSVANLAAAKPPAEGERSLSGRPASGSLVFATSLSGTRSLERLSFLHQGLALLTELADIEGERKHDFAGRARGLEFDLVEAQGELVVRLAIDTDSTADADHLEQSLRAQVTALSSAELAPETGNRLGKLLAGLRIETPAARLLVSYRYEVASFVGDVLYAEKHGAGAPKR